MDFRPVSPPDVKEEPGIKKEPGPDPLVSEAALQLPDLVTPLAVVLAVPVAPLPSSSPQVSAPAPAGANLSAASKEPKSATGEGANVSASVEKEPKQPPLFVLSDEEKSALRFVDKHFVVPVEQALSRHSLYMTQAVAETEQLLADRAKAPLGSSFPAGEDLPAALSIIGTETEKGHCLLLAKHIVKICRHALGRIASPLPTISVAPKYLLAATAVLVAHGYGSLASKAEEMASAANYLEACELAEELNNEVKTLLQAIDEEKQARARELQQQQQQQQQQRQQQRQQEEDQHQQENDGNLSDASLLAASLLLPKPPITALPTSLPSAPTIIASQPIAGVKRKSMSTSSGAASASGAGVAGKAGAGAGERPAKRAATESSRRRSRDEDEEESSSDSESDGGRATRSVGGRSSAKPKPSADDIAYYWDEDEGEDAADIDLDAVPDDEDFSLRQKRIIVDQYIQFLVDEAKAKKTVKSTKWLTEASKLCGVDQSDAKAVADFLSLSESWLHAKPKRDTLPAFSSAVSSSATSESGEAGGAAPAVKRPALLPKDGFSMLWRTILRRGPSKVAPKTYEEHPSCQPGSKCDRVHLANRMLQHLANEKQIALNLYLSDIGNPLTVDDACLAAQKGYKFLMLVMVENGFTKWEDNGKSAEQAAKVGGSETLVTYQEIARKFNSSRRR